jgi:hypothetical protein
MERRLFSNEKHIFKNTKVHQTEPKGHSKKGKIFRFINLIDPIHSTKFPIISGYFYHKVFGMAPK